MQKDYSGVVVFAQQSNGQIHRVSYELLNCAKELAKHLDSQVYSIVLGSKGVEVQELIYHGSDKVYYCEDEIFDSPDELIYKENIVNILKEIKPEIILIGATNFGRSIAPRISAALNTGLTADCTGLKIDEVDGKLVQIRPAFSENILAHIKTDTYPQMATIRYKEFPEGQRDEQYKGKIENIKPIKIEKSLVKTLEKVSEQEVNITEAEVVVAGGRGVKTPDDLKLLNELAQCLGGVVGVSRPLIDEGYMTKEHQVGYSGNRVKPKIYIACGISGAPQHLAGMKESEVIIAVNNDPSAPIFEVADYGVVGDLYEVIPQLINKFKSSSEATA